MAAAAERWPLAQWRCPQTAAQRTASVAAQLISMRVRWQNAMTWLTSSTFAPESADVSKNLISFNVAVCAPSRAETSRLFMHMTQHNNMQAISKHARQTGHLLPPHKATARHTHTHTHPASWSHLVPTRSLIDAGLQCRSTSRSQARQLSNDGRLQHGGSTHASTLPDSSSAVTRLPPHTAQAHAKHPCSWEERQYSDGYRPCDGIRNCNSIGAAKVRPCEGTKAILTRLLGANNENSCDT